MATSRSWSLKKPTLSMGLFMLLTSLGAGCADRVQELRFPKPDDLPASKSWTATGQTLVSVHFPTATRGWTVGGGGTILTTTDAGVTWYPQRSDVEAYLRSVHFVDARRGWAVGDEGTILATSDGGETWEPQGSGTDNRLYSVYFATALRGWVVGVRTIRTTSDGGETWTEQMSREHFGLSSVRFIDETQGWAVGAQGKIVATSDGGETWRDQESGIDDGDLWSVCFVSSSQGWAVGHQGTILTTSDGGETWKPQRSGTDADLFSVRFLNRTRGWAFGRDGTILATTDGGQTWTPRSPSLLLDADLVGAHFASATHGWVVGKAGLILDTTDGGESWKTRTPSSGTDQHLKSIHFVDPKHGWAAGAGGTILATTDGGDTWTRRRIDLDNFLLSIDFHDLARGWAVGTGGIVLSTKDRGKTWQHQTSGTDSTLWSVYFVDENHGWAVGVSGAALATADGGMTWTPGDTGGSDASLRSIHFPTPTLGWAVGTKGTILTTADRGATWTPQSSGTAGDLWSVRFVSETQGWVAGERGVLLATTDGGETWIPQSSGTHKGLIALHFLDANNGWAAGNDGTFLVTEDGGSTWTPEVLNTNTHFGSVHFLSKTSGWVAGRGGVIMRATAGDYAPFVKIFSMADNHTRLTWTVEDDRDPAHIRSSLDFRVGLSGKWEPLRKKIEPTQTQGRTAVFETLWQPASEDYRVQAGVDLYYRFVLADQTHERITSETGPFPYQSVHQRLTKWWEDLGQRRLGKFLQGGLLLVLLTGFYIGSVGAVLMIRPAWLLRLSRLQVETIVKTSGPNRLVGLILETLFRLSLGRYFLRHRRTRRAWIRRFAEGVATLEELVPEVRAHFLDQDDVLDAWVERYARRVGEVFLDRDTVHQRRIHIPMPVQVGEKTLPQLRAADLRSTFDQRRCLEIWGKGGSGKTSLACQVARWALADDPRDRLSPHRMLPVLVEPGFTFEVGDGQDPLREAILGQLCDAADLADPIPQDLLEKLLRHRRVLVILDSLSEMGIEARRAIEPARADFAAHALVVTSRWREDLRIRHTEVNPLIVDGTRLLSFFEAYFAQRGQQDLFDSDEEVYSACQQLARMVGNRHATILFARIFADQMIAQKMEGTSNALDLPETLPDLMLRYLNELNRKVQGDPLENREIHAAAKIVAWECLRESFRPRPARLDAVDAALGGKERARPLLDHLERRLGIVKMIEPGWNHVRFTLDPLVEFLAGLHLVETWAGDDACWQDFLVAAKGTEGSPDSIREFLLAVRDCCRARGREHGVPAGIEAALDEITS